MNVSLEKGKSKLSVQKEEMILHAEDGFNVEGFVARAQGHKKGGIVVLQEIFGVTDQLKSVARSYAEDGYDTIVPALFDRASPQTVVSFDTPTVGRDLALGLDPDKVQMDVLAAAGAVDSDFGVSLIGFCWGGGQAFRLSCNLNLRSAIAFYGTSLEKHLSNCPGGPKCPMLFHFGETDDHTPPEIVEAVRQQVPSAEIEMYKAGHAFANDARPDIYVEEAAKQARRRTLEFLNRNHGG